MSHHVEGLSCHVEGLSCHVENQKLFRCVWYTVFSIEKGILVEKQEEEQKIEVRRMTDEDIEKIPYHVVQSNSLVRANYGLEILEHKVINATISQIRKSDSKITAFFFTYKQLSSLCNIDMKNIRRQIQNVADGILDKKFTILGMEKKGVDKNENMENVILRGRWISLIKIYPKRRKTPSFNYGDIRRVL